MMAADDRDERSGALQEAGRFSCREFLVRHIEDILRFYVPRVKDPAGGFHQNFYIDGRQFNQELKQIVSSARLVINFMLSGKLLNRPDLLELGKHGLDFLDAFHLVADGELYAFTLRDNKPDDMTQHAYGYAFVLAAHAAARLAGVTSSGEGLGRVFDLMERRFWLPDHCAYADSMSPDGVLDAYRGQNSNMHICEALILAHRATGEDRYIERAEILAETFVQRLAAKSGGFVWEHYTSNFDIDWDYNKNDRTNIYRPWGFQPGHQIEWTKNLLNICRHTRKDWMLQRARELFDRAFAIAWDDLHRGLVYGFGPDEQWCDADKYFWVQAESMASAALLYEATGDAKYKDRYEALWSYICAHWVDHEHGAWYCFKQTRDNRRCSDEKAISGAKCDYHPLVSCIEALNAFP